MINKKVFNILVVFSISLILFSLLSTYPISADHSNAQCHDGFDNDNNGRRDRLELATSENTQTTFNTGPFTLTHLHKTTNALKLSEYTIESSAVGKLTIKDITGTFTIHRPIPTDQNRKYILNCKDNTGTIPERLRVGPFIEFYDKNNNKISAPKLQLKDAVNKDIPKNTKVIKAIFIDAELNNFNTKYVSDSACTFKVEITRPLADVVECSDRIDNGDSDDAVDGDDGGCYSPLDKSEEPHDLGCSSIDDTTESSTQCSDGINNDGTDDGIDALIERDLCPLVPSLPVFAGETTTSSSEDRSSLTYSHATPEGNDRLLIVTIHTDDNNNGFDAVTYNGQSLTKIKSQSVDGDNLDVAMYYLVNPPTGSHNVIVDWKGTAKGHTVSALSFNNVDQSDPIGASSSSKDEDTDNNRPTTTLTTEEDKSLIIGAASIDDNAATFTPGSGVTEHYDQRISGELSSTGGTKPTNNKGSKTISFTSSKSEEWAIVAAEIKGKKGFGDCIQPECADGLDNDDDNKFDFCLKDGSNSKTCDLECESPKDISEEKHDPDCEDDTDDDESSDTQQCSDSQTILRLSKTGSAFVGLYNHQDYKERLCYNKIFNLEPGNDPHTCKPNSNNPKNLVLWVSSEQLPSSKISTTKTDVYDTPICYENLGCRAVNTDNNEACDTDAGEKFIFSLQNLEGSKVRTVVNSDFPFHLCCKTPNVKLTERGFYDMRDRQIPNTDKVDKNDLVQLVVEGENLQDEEIEYKIIEIDGGFLFLDKEVATISTRGFLRWRAVNNNDGDDAKFYFEAKIGDNDPIDSRKLPKPNKGDNPIGILTVKSTENNSPPVANILSPDNGIYFTGTDILFDQDSYDEDDEFTFTWDLGDGTTEADLPSFTKIYPNSQTGQKNIQLTITDDRNLDDTDERTLLLLDPNEDDEKYILAKIDNPMEGETYTRTVQYDARSTYALKVNTNYQDDDQCSIIINCEGGLCPAETVGLPGCYLERGDTDPIQITNVPDENNPANYNPIKFCWEFDQDPTGDFCEPGDAGVQFDKTYSDIMSHRTILTAHINPSSSTEVTFFSFFNAPTCHIIEGESFWKVQGSLAYNSEDDCHKDDGVGNMGTDMNQCCKNNFHCENDKCVPDEVIITSCNQITDPDECNGFINNAIRDELQPIIEDDYQIFDECDQVRNYPFNREVTSCFQSISCFCEWDTNTELCSATTSHRVQKEDSEGDVEFDWAFNNLPEDGIEDECNVETDDDDHEFPVTGQCTFDFSYDGSCSDGRDFITRSWVATYTPNDLNCAGQTDSFCSDRYGSEFICNTNGKCILNYCQDGSEIIACEKVVRLPFFGIQQLLITIISIFFIYYIMHKKDNK